MVLRPASLKKESQSTNKKEEEECTLKVKLTQHDMTKTEMMTQKKMVRIKRINFYKNISEIMDADFKT
jgi:hypothetical protein